jgi:hypothetical protein
MTIIAGALLFMTGALIAGQNPTGAERFDRAQVIERTAGVDAAIAAYQSILQDFPSDRALAAKTLVQMGKLHELLGQSQLAWAEYQRVVNEYTDQTGPAAEAAARLKALTPTPRELNGIFIGDMDPMSGAVRNVRLLTENPTSEETNPRVSSDGKTIAFTRRVAQGSRGGIADRGAIIRSLQTKSEWAYPCPFSVDPRIQLGTPRGNPSPFPICNFPPYRFNGSILLVVANGIDNRIGRLDTLDGKFEEFTRNIDSGLSWTLSPDEQTMYGATSFRVGVSTVTPVAVLERATMKVTRTMILPIDNGSGDNSKLNPGIGLVMTISPNGKTIAIYSTFNQGVHISLFDVQGADLKYRELPLMSGGIRYLVWSPDGSSLFVSRGNVQNPFSAGQLGQSQLLKVPIDGGATTFTGLEITGLSSFDLSADGKTIVFDGTDFKVSPPSATIPPLQEPDPARGGRGGRG